MSYKSKHSFLERREQSSRILVKYPTRVPVICEKLPRSNIKELDRKKYLVPSDITFRSFIAIIRKRLKLDNDIGMYFFFTRDGSDIMVPTSHMIALLYDEYQDKDGFLYITYAGESTFG